MARYLKPGDKVIYFGYELPRRRGDLCFVHAVYESDVVIVFQADNHPILCKPQFLKKVTENDHH